MGFVRVTAHRVRSLHQAASNRVLMGCNAETSHAPLSGQGVLIRWALKLILQEADREADALAKPRSSFHCPEDWSWDSLKNFTLRSQHDVATEQSPIIWSILTTIAVSKERRKVDERGEGGDKRDPWQVSWRSMGVYLTYADSSGRGLLLSYLSCFIFGTARPHSSHVPSA